MKEPLASSVYGISIIITDTFDVHTFGPPCMIAAKTPRVKSAAAHVEVLECCVDACGLCTMYTARGDYRDWRSNSGATAHKLAPRPPRGGK